MLDERFFGQLDAMRKNGEHRLIIGVIEALPESERSLALTVSLARAYCDLAVSGGGVDRDMFRRAALILRDEPGGENDPEWNFTFGTALSGIGKDDEAAPYFERALNLMSAPSEPVEGTLPAEGEWGDADRRAVGAHIRKYFGSYTRVIREKLPCGEEFDICVIPPSDGRDHYTIITNGMSSHKMNVPADFANDHLDRAELMIAIPADADIERCLDDGYIGRWNWTVDLLRGTACLPEEADTWLGWGHTVSGSDKFAPYDPAVGFCGAILVMPGKFGSESAACLTPCGALVNFYQLVPLYPEELQYKFDHDAESLLAYFGEDGLAVVDPDRRAVVKDESIVVDSAAPHISCIRKKSLDTDELSAYSHMAIYLRWCIVNGLMSDVFLEEFGDLADDVANGRDTVDLRIFLRDKFGGALTYPIFNCRGVDFTRRYYMGEDDTRSYPADIDDCALDYFGEDEYYSDKFHDEAYLFVPYDEDYYERVAAVIDERYEEWLGYEGADEREESLCIPLGKMTDMLPDFVKAPRGCLATDRVMIDGEQIAVIFRDRPDAADTGWDSGWRFMTSDEYDEYAGDEEYPEVMDNLHPYDLNTLCNYEPDARFLLDAPYGAVFTRGDDGNFYRSEG